MNKELPLDERIQKLFGSGWVNEFNYLENQLQEARYLLACLNEKYNQLTNNWNELEEFVKDMLFTTPHENQMLDLILDKMKQIKEGNK